MENSVTQSGLFHCLLHPSRLRSIHAKKTGKRDSGAGGEETQTPGTPTVGRKRKRKAGDSDDDEDDEEDSDDQGDEDDEEEEECKKGKKVEACEDEVSHGGNVGGG